MAGSHGGAQMTVAGSGVLQPVPPVRRAWGLAARPEPVVAILRGYDPAAATVTLAAVVGKKEVERTLPVTALRGPDLEWLRRLANDSPEMASPVPVNRSTDVILLEPWVRPPRGVAIASEERRPCIEIHGIAGEVRFLGRIGKQDRVFWMTDPAFRKAVKEGTLPALIGESYVKTEPNGALSIPVKMAGFPMLGQEQSGTCYIAYYREWFYYYLGSRAEMLPMVDGYREFLNFLLEDNPDVGDLFEPGRRKSVGKFDADSRLAKREWSQFREQIGFLIVNYFMGAEVTADSAWKPVSAHGDDDYGRRTRKALESRMGEIMQSLLLGQMTIGRGENHVMSIIGVDGDKLTISTWGREFKGTLRQLAQADRRGPMLAPLEFRSYPVVARNEEGRAVFPKVPDYELRGQSKSVLDAWNRFWRG